MNINLQHSYHQLSVRGRITDPFKLPQGKLNASSLINHHWPLNSFDFYLSVDEALSMLKEQLQQQVRKVRVSYRNKCQQISMSKLILKLKDWLKIIKKSEFYHVDLEMKDIFYGEEGLMNLYQCGNIQIICLLSEIQKYRAKNIDQEQLTLKDLLQDQLEIIFKDVCLKISKHLLSEFKNEMYYPSRQLVLKLLKFYGFSYDFNLSFQDNYQNALLQRKYTVNPNQQSRESIIVLFTFKMICCFQSLSDVCYYVSYLKNILLDRSSGVLTAQYETWLLLYEISLKMFGRYQNIRAQECIEVDQILSSSFADTQFQGFLMKNALKANVSLSSINFYIKNCKRQEKEQLKSIILFKINALIENNFWKYIEDIFQYIQNQLQGEQKEDYIDKIKTKVSSLIYEGQCAYQLYEVQYGLTFILQNLIKYVHQFQELLNKQGLEQITKIIKEKHSNQKILIAFRMFNQYISMIYSQTSYESMDLPAVQDLLVIMGLFQDNNYVCHKSVFKFVYYQLSSEQFDEEIWDTFFGLLAQVYFSGGYEENSDLELIHSHEKYRQALANKILKVFQILISSQISQRKQLINCIENKKQLLKSYFLIRSFKDSLLFQSIQNICLIFNSHLSMQTLQFGLNYCTAFSILQSWRTDESQMSLLSLICEEMPIETLKFIYKQVCSEQNIETHLLQSIPATFWSGYWEENRKSCAFAFAEDNINIQQFDALQKLRRFEFILNLSCCVFDKLNENSQKNIKQIKIIYEKGAGKIIEIANKLKTKFLQSLNISIVNKVQCLSGQQVKNLQIIDSQGSFLLTNYIKKNYFLFIARQFNLIGRINQSVKLIEVEEALLPSLKQIKFNPKDKAYELLYKQIELCLNIQASYLKKLIEKEENFTYQVQVTKDWAKHLITNCSSLITLLKKQNPKQKENIVMLNQIIGNHIKCLISKLMVPEMLVFLLTGECKPVLSKHLFSLMKVGFQLIYIIDNEYEQHFIVVIEKIDELFRQSKNKQMQSQHILSLLELFFELIFNKIRIRSYHLYRIIKFYQKVTQESTEQFNTIISQHIRVLFEEFITNYKNINEINHLCSSKKNINPNYSKFARHEHSLNYIETACTLSMFINLFCRLNYSSLTIGVQKIFCEDQSKVIYIDYLTSLTRKIVTEEIEISQRDLQILKIDVYGNLNIITQGRLSQRLMNKLISLAKNLLRVKTDLKGVNKLPIKILADKIAAQNLQINLEQFEDECKAISLGAISVHKKLAIHITSNLHLCNIFYVTGRNFQKYIELNHMIWNKNRQQTSQEVGKVARIGLSAFHVQIGEEIYTALEGLMHKLQKYYQISSNSHEYAQKFYSIFKIICISCLNNPQILPLLMTQQLVINKKTVSFYEFVFMTLKDCLPLFCQFYTAVIKTNSGFIKIAQDQIISKNLQFQLTIKKRLLTLFKEQITKKQSQYIYLTKAINYVQQYSDSNRFRFYKFVKNSNDVYQSILRQFEKDFNIQLIKISEQYINKNYSSFSCFEIYQLLQVALEKSLAQTPALDLKKLHNQQEIKKAFYCEGQNIPQGNKQNLADTERKRSETSEYTRPKSDSFSKLLIKSLQYSHNPSQCIVKGKKAKDTKQIRCNYLQQDLINLNDSKFIISDWKSNFSNKQKSPINAIMVERFMLFNQQIENRQFLKDVIIFPTKINSELTQNSGLSNQDGINEDQANQSSQHQNNDDIIESIDSIKECDEVINFSQKNVEESQPLYEFIENQQRHEVQQSSSMIYSQIEIEHNQDGSMKLFGDDDIVQIQEQQQINQQVSKNDIVELIQDYTLNPEAIKQIVYKIKYLSTRELQKLHSQQSGEIAYVLEGELRHRGILIPTQVNNYQYFFMDQSKIYQRLKNKRIQQKEKEFFIPQFSTAFLREWFKVIFKAIGKHQNLSKKISSFCRRMLLQMKNINMIIYESLQVLKMDNNTFELRYKDVITFTKKYTPQYYKQALIDQIFGLMIEYRIGLPIIFFGNWNAEKGLVSSRNKQAKDESIIEIILSVLIKSNEKQSFFLKNLLDYIQVLNKTTKYQYPYLQIQDSIVLSKRILQQLSVKMHSTNQAFSQNQKYFKMIKIMTYLQTKSYQQLLKIQLAKITDVVKKSYLKQDNILQVFRKNYAMEQGLQIERKAQIYWQLRKSKNADQHNTELIYCRKIFTDLASIVLEKLKENCFNLYYKREQLIMKEELLYLRRKMNQMRNYSQKYELQAEFKEKEKRYSFWKRNLINLIIVQEIVPAVEEISVEFLEQIKQTAGLLSQLYSNFCQIASNTPILFKQSAQYYKIILAYELLKKQEQQTFHSMSTLKTIPSIQSTRQMDGGRRRSSLAGRHSIFQISCIDTSSILKKSASMFTMDSLAMQPNNPLFGIHAKNADMETKLKFLKQQNKLGQKIIEVERQNMWISTAPHLDDNFGNYDIKIKIQGQIGIDYGGVTREWLHTIVKQILDPRLGLFQLNVNQLAFQPSRLSYLVPNHLNIFHKFGILVGKAMKQNWLLQLNFTKSFLKHILGALLYVEDLEDIQPDTAKGLLWILKNYVDQDLGLNFTYDEIVLDNKRTVELVPGGTQVYVNQMNKKEYVKKLAYTKMTQSIREQSLAFISGVQKVISLQMLKMFNYRQIGKYFAGVSTIDVGQMKTYAKYQGYSQENENIKWFWQSMQQKSEQDKAQFLFFLTGSYRVPYSGFKDNPVTINKMPGCKDYLPVAHTCFSIIDLPEYSSKDKLECMLWRAVKQGKGFTVS